MWRYGFKPYLIFASVYTVFGNAFSVGEKFGHWLSGTPW